VHYVRRCNQKENNDETLRLLWAKVRTAQSLNPSGLLLIEKPKVDHTHQLIVLQIGVRVFDRCTLHVLST
jgi:hypothetical protein